MDKLKSPPPFLSPTGPISNCDYIVVITALGYLKVAFVSVMRSSAAGNKIPPYHGSCKKEKDKKIQGRAALKLIEF